MKNVWNGDEDLGNGEVQRMRADYDSRIECLYFVEPRTKSANRAEMERKFNHFRRPPTNGHNFPF
jgi:hypothetical protein